MGQNKRRLSLTIGIDASCLRSAAFDINSAALFCDYVEAETPSAHAVALRSSGVVVGIEFSQAVRAHTVTEFRLGMRLDVSLQGLPGLVLILDSFAGSTHR